MKVLLYFTAIAAITALLFISHYVTSYYTYTIIGGIKYRNYVINFFDSGFRYWFWLFTTLFSLFYIIVCSFYLVKGGGVMDLSRFGSLAWFWYMLAGLGLIVPIYHLGGVLINVAHKISLDYFGAAYPSVMINLICIVGIVVYNMYRLVGEKPNKYMWATLILAAATTICAMLSVEQYTK